MTDQNPSRYGGPQPDPSVPPGQGQFGPAPTGEGQFGPAPSGQGQFGPAGQPPPGTPGTPPAKKGGRKKVVFTVLGVLVALAVALGVWAGVSGGLDALGGDRTAEAKQGDCLGDLNAPAEGQTTEANNAKVVDCASTDAKFTVVGRIDDKTEAEATAAACTAYPDASLVYFARKGGATNGYILCLAPKQ